MEKPRVKSTSGPPALPPRTVFNVDVKSLVKAFAEKSQQNQSYSRPSPPSKNNNTSNNISPVQSHDKKDIREQQTVIGNDGQQNGKASQKPTAIPPPAPVKELSIEPTPVIPVAVESPKEDPIINVQQPEVQDSPAVEQPLPEQTNSTEQTNLTEQTNTTQQTQQPEQPLPPEEPQSNYTITRNLKPDSRALLTLSMQRRPSEVEISTTLSAMKELIEQKSQVIRLHEHVHLSRSAPFKRSLPVPKSKPPKPPIKPPSLAVIPRPKPEESVTQPVLSENEAKIEELKPQDTETQKPLPDVPSNLPTEPNVQTTETSTTSSMPDTPNQNPPEQEQTNADQDTTPKPSTSPAKPTTAPPPIPRKTSRPLPVPPRKSSSNLSSPSTTSNRNRSSSLPQQVSSTAPQRELPKLPEKRIKSLLSATGSTSDSQIIVNDPPTSPRPLSPRPPASPRPPTAESPEPVQQPTEKPLPAEPEPPVNTPRAENTQTWYQYLTEEGYTYYYNNDSNETAWELPGVSEGNTNVWEISKTEEGSYYYYNLSTFQSTWQLPAASILIDRSYVYSINNNQTTTTSTTPSDDQSKMNYQRRKVIEELIDTERAYVTDLRFIDQKYLKPLRSQNIISEEESQKLFSNILTILSVNTELLMGLEGINTQQLNEAEFFIGATEIISDVFEKMCPSLRSYADYAANQMVALESIDKLKKSNKQFNDFLKKVKALPESRDLRLDAFLVKPIQRLCKYPLLFRELIKSTPESEQGHSRLKGVAELLEGVAMYANEFKRTVENARKLEHIDKILGGSKKFSVSTVAGRFYLMEGKCTVTLNGKSSKEYLFLMSDCLLFCESQTSLSTKKRYMFRRMLPLDEYIKVDYLNLNEDSQFYFNLIDMNGASTESGYLTYALCPESDCKKWFSTLQRLLQEKQQPSGTTESFTPPMTNSGPSSPLVSVRRTDSTISSSADNTPLGTPIMLRARSPNATPESARRRSRSMSPSKADMIASMDSSSRPGSAAPRQGSFRHPLKRKGSTDSAVRKAFYSTMESKSSSSSFRSSDGGLPSENRTTSPVNTDMLAELKGRFRASSQGPFPSQ